MNELTLSWICLEWKLNLSAKIKVTPSQFNFLEKRIQRMFCRFYSQLDFNLGVCKHCSLGIWGVEGAVCKILELCDQNPWRNNLSKLATFDPISQRPHSALVRLCPALNQITFNPELQNQIKSWKEDLNLCSRTFVRRSNAFFVVLIFPFCVSIICKNLPFL